ncbi:class IV adenylate cyclase [Patescibacteria group bacterium]
MDIEFEATFPDVNKNEFRTKLKRVGAKLVRSEFLQKRIVFHLPSGHKIKGGWLRVRDEGDKVTMSLKVIAGKNIEDQKEIMIVVDDFEKAKELLVSIGCIEKAFQENKRELWDLDGVEVAIDEWPYLEPFVEIEGPSEKIVKAVSEKLGFDWSEAIFGPLDVLVEKKYGIPKKVINDETRLLVFGGENPWEKWLSENRK